MKNICQRVCLFCCCCPCSSCYLLYKSSEIINRHCLIGVCQLYLPNQDELALSLAGEIQRMVKRRHAYIDLRICQHSSELEENPVLIGCINSTRLGANVVGASKELSVSESYAIVILHPQLSHVDPPISSSGMYDHEISSTNANYSIGGVFDLTFHPENGIYQQDEANINQLNDIARFISRNTHTFRRVCWYCWTTLSD